VSPLLSLVFAVTAAVFAGLLVFLVVRRASASRIKPGESLPVGVGEVFTVIGMAYVILLGFVSVEAFESFQRARTSARAEAHAVAEGYMVAGLLPRSHRDGVQRDIMCYAQAVTSSWDGLEERLAAGEVDPDVEAAQLRIQRSLDRVPVEGEKANVAYEYTVIAHEERMRERAARLTEGSVFVPHSLWILLWIGAAIIMTFVIFFTLFQRRRWLQVSLITLTIVMFAVMFGSINLLDHPFSNSPGAVSARAMDSALARMELLEGAKVSESECDERALE